MRQRRGGALLAFTVALFATRGDSPLEAQVVAPPQIQQAAPSPPPPPLEKGTLAIVGQVVDSRGNGVPEAVVTLQGGLQPIALTTTNRAIFGGPRSTRTTDEGYFAFFELAPGTYALDASKPGFMGGAYGRVRPGGLAHSFMLRENEAQAPIRLPIWEFASITGTVRDEAGEAVVGVQVRALRRQIVHGRFQFVSGAFVTTDDRGEYRIDGLQPGRYTVLVASTQRSVPVMTLPPMSGPLTPTSTPAEIETQLMRNGISRAGIFGGGREVAGQLWSASRTSTMAVPDPDDSGRTLVYPTTFHPAARSVRQAAVLSVESGEHRPAVDLQMRLVPAGTVSGVITGNIPMAGIMVRLVPDYIEDLSGDVTQIETAVTVCDPSGRFVFIGVPAGQYFLQTEVVPEPPTAAGVPSPVTRRGWLNERITVDEDGVSGLSIPVRSTVRISGRIAFDGSKPPPSPELIQRLTVSIETIGFAVNRAEAPYQTTFDKDGNFVLPGVPPGRYVLTFRAAIVDRQAMPDWEFKSIMLGDRDLADRPAMITEDLSGVVVTLTNTNTQLSGTVRDLNGKVDSHAVVLMFTAERELWTVRSVRRIRAARASETGAYVVRGVPPGDYFVIAIPDVQIGDFPDPAMLDALARTATRFSVAPAQQVTQNLVVTSIIK